MNKLDFTGMRAFCSFYEKKLKADEDIETKKLDFSQDYRDRCSISIIGNISNYHVINTRSYYPGDILISLDDEDAKYLYGKYIKLLMENNQRKEDLFLGENI